LFLSREGYLFKQLYDGYCNIYGKDSSKGVYFLASRRAVSVAAVKSEEDIKSILNQYYRGSLSNLLNVRLGINIYSEMEDIDVNMPDDIDKIMAMLKPHINDILVHAEEERETYLAYIDSIVDKNDTIAVVDVGYSGTIQYYLAKLLEWNLSGYYLSTWVDKKPEALGCVCSAPYPVVSYEEEHTAKVFKNQLFLEVALKAPFGQLIKFENGIKGIKGIYKDDNDIGDAVTQIQAGILDFEDKYLSVLQLISIYNMVDQNLVEDIFAVVMQGEWFSENVAEIFSVQDDYCSNGNQVYDNEKKTWVVR